MKAPSIANKIDKFRYKRILRQNENQQQTFRLQHVVRDVNMMDEELLDSPYPEQQEEPRKSKMLRDLLIMASHDSMKHVDGPPQ